MLTLGFATTNPHKLAETEACMSSLLPSIRVVSLPPSQDVEETGSTFAENARLKLAACLSEGIPDTVDIVIAEDAGLVIPALDGQYGLSPFPGVKSHRWFDAAVQQALLGRVTTSPDYQEINAGIIALMQSQSDRRAAYVTALAVWIRRADVTLDLEGQVELTVLTAPRGENGFGYDPIMSPVGLGDGRSMAELTMAEKNTLSHRFQALKQLARYIDSVMI